MTNKALLTLLYSKDSANALPALTTTGDAVLDQISERFNPNEDLPHLNSSRFFSSYLIRDNDFRILELLDEMGVKSQTSEILECLQRIVTLLQNASVDVRLPVYRKFNLFLLRAARKYGANRELFLTCAELLLALKRQGEVNKQTQMAASKLEWVELEKTVYHLSLWEDQMETARI